MGGWIDAAAARLAIELALPSVERVLRHRPAGDSGCLHVVVAAPDAAGGGSDFDSCVLAEHSVNRAGWDADYALYARAKAKVSWRLGVDGHVAQTRFAHRLQPGDTLLWGAVNLDGIVVGVSGLHPGYDEAVALAIAALLRARAKGAASAALARGPFIDGSAGT